jgi:hypothetical protein
MAKFNVKKDTASLVSQFTKDSSAEDFGVKIKVQEPSSESTSDFKKRAE